MRPTTKDLAKAAGVSLATVDRVLNERSGVRKKTVDAVNEAIDRIGFVRNLSAANLARQRIYRLAFVLPEEGDEFLGALRGNIDEAQRSFALQDIAIECITTPASDPYRTAQIISDLQGQGFDGVAVMAPSSPQVRDASLRLSHAGIKVVGFVSGQQSQGDIGFVGIDNRAAGATAARLLGRFTVDRTGSVLVITEAMQAQDSVERRLGFDRVLGANFPNLVALPSLETHGRPDRTRTIIENAFTYHRDIMAVYVMASEGRQALSHLAKMECDASRVVVAHERTAFTEALLRDGTLDAVIAQSPGHLVRSAVRTLRARIDGNEPIASQERIRIEILIRENLV